MKLVSLFIFSVILACSNSNSNDAFEPNIYEDGGFATEKTAVEVEMVESVGQSQKPEITQKIIKTGYLDFETQELDKTDAKIKALTKKYEGVITTDQSGKDYRSIYKRLTVRVPSQHFDAMVAGIADGVAYFDRKEISQRDVTEEFVDLEARLKAKKELENRYLQLLSKAKNVKEMLEIERELSSIREEIEAKQGRLNYLKSQVSMSTLHCSFYTTTVETGVTQSYGTKMVNALKSGWQGVSVFFIGILTLWPLFVIILIVVLVIRTILKKNKKS